MLEVVGHLIRELLRRERVDFAGGTSLARDACDVYQRYRRREPLLDGPHVREFEQALSEYHGGLEVITFAAGRMALHAILKAMNFPAGAEIIMPGYTCIVIPSAVQRAGLKPVYVDVSRQNFNVVPELVARAITPRTRAILVQDTFGVPCERDALLDISQRTGVPLIEDGAHALGARWNGRMLGQFGDAAFFSTQATKMLSTERGGYAVTADARLAQSIRDIQQRAKYGSLEYERACVLRWCYRAGLYGVPLLNPRLRIVEAVLTRLGIRSVDRILRFDAAEYDAALAGQVFSPYPARLPNLMAYAGLLQLRRLEEDLSHRRHLAAYLETELPRMGAQVAAYDHQRAQPSWVRYPFVVGDRAPWMASMERCGLSPGVWLNDPIHPKNCNWTGAGYVRGQCPDAEFLAQHILNVPVHRRVAPRYLEKWIRHCRRRRLG